VGRTITVCCNVIEVDKVEDPTKKVYHGIFLDMTPFILRMYGMYVCSYVVLCYGETVVRYPVIPTVPQKNNGVKNRTKPDR
jgi:hypothetical protein